MRPCIGLGGAIRLVLALALLAGGGWPGHAQKAPTLDPAREAAARELLMAQGGVEQARKAMDQMLGAMLAELKRTNPDVAPEGERFLKEYFGRGNANVNAYLDRVLASSIAFYAERMTVEELRQATAFLSSPVGAKFMALAPEATTVIVPHFVEFQKQLKADVEAAARRGEFGKKQ